MTPAPATVEAYRALPRATPHIGTRRSMPGDPVTPRQQAVADFLRRTWAQGRSLPTVRGVCAVFGMTSTNAVFQVFEALVRKGVLRRDGSRALDIAVEPVRPVVGCVCAACAELAGLGVEPRP